MNNSFVQITIRPIFIKNSIPVANVLSSICPLAHHPAFVLIHSGMFDSFSDCVSVKGTTIIPCLIKCSIPSMNAESGICPLAHHPALFFTHSGI